MKRILVPIADGFEEIETTCIVDVLRRAGLSVTLAGVKSGPLKGSRGVYVVPDSLLSDCLREEWDMVVLPGGQPGVNNLRQEASLTAVLKERHADKNLIAAICAAPLILKDASIIEGLSLTSHPSVEKELGGAVYSCDRVVISGHIITSRGPGTAIEFALSLVNILVGKSKADEISEAVLALGTYSCQ